MKGHEILVPSDIKEFYSISPENRKSLIIESINAAGHQPPSPLLIMQGRRIMQNWFQEGLPTGTLTEVSKSGFITDKIAIEFLKHFIANTNSGPTKQ